MNQKLRDESDRSSAEFQVKHDKSSVAITNSEADLCAEKRLDKTPAYYDKLNPSCVDAGVDFEDRAARRGIEYRKSAGDRPW